LEESVAEATLFAGERYHVLEELGQGGMGAVYLVDDLVRGERLALKVMSAPGALDEADLLRFKQEFRAMASLRHPNLCAVYDYGQLPDGAPYFTMEHVPGLDLHEAIPSDPAGLLPLIGQLSRALGYVHQQGLVHGDLKPENVRVRADGTLKLMDFGLMSPAGQALESIRGTLAYVSPEVAKRDRIDQRSDLYSLGVVLYELLAGEKPIRGANALQLLRAHLNEAPRPLKEVRADVPADLARVVMALLAKEPVARPQSAREVLLALGLETEGTDSQALLASPFVGRQAVLAHFDDVLSDVRTMRQGAVLRLIGPSGIGKGRLLSELRFKVQLQDTPFLHGQCSAEPLPYGPWIAVLRALVPLASLHCPATLAEQGPLLARLLPELAGDVPREALEPEQEKSLIQGAIAHLLAETTVRRGAVLVFEDWDQADALSLETLAYVLRNARAQAGGGASGELADWPLLVVLSGVQLEGTGEAVALPGLALEDVERLLEGMLGQTELPNALVAQIHQLTGGIPRLIEDTLEHAVVHGAFERTAEGWRLPNTLSSLALGTDVRQLLEDRLAKLSPAAREAGRMVAVLGRGFNLALAAGVLALPEEHLFDVLAELVHAKILNVGSRGYRFATPELEEILLAELPPSRQQALHVSAADCITRTFPATGSPVLADLASVTRHYIAAGKATLAVPRVVEAARLYRLLSDYQAYERLLVAGESLLAELPDTAEWGGIKADYQNALAYALRRAGKMLESTAAAEEALRLGEVLGDKARQMVAYIELAQTIGLRGEQRSCVELNARAIVLAGELGDFVAHSRAAANSARALYFLGEREQAIATFKVAVEFGERGNSPLLRARALAGLGHIQAIDLSMRDEGFANLALAAATQASIGDKYGEATSQNLIGDINMECGRYPEALRANAAFVNLARQQNSHEDLLCALITYGLNCLELGLFLEAASTVRELLLLPDWDQWPLSPIGIALMGTLEAAKGHLVEGERLLRESEALLGDCPGYVLLYGMPVILAGWSYLARPKTTLAIAQETAFKFRAMADVGAKPVLALTLGELYAELGQWDLAEEQATEAYAAATAIDHRGNTARAIRLKGAIALERGRLDEAATLAEKGQALAAQLAMLPLQAGYMELQGEIARASGRQDAIAHFQAMQTLADRLGTPLLRARALFGQARVNGSLLQAAGLLTEAQRVIAELCEPLDEAPRQEFLLAPMVAAIMAEDPSTRRAPSGIEGSRQIGERFTRMSADLQGLAGQYDMLFQEWQSNNDQLRKLNELAIRMNESLLLEEVLQQVLALTLEITKAERGFIVLKVPGRFEELLGRAALDHLDRPLLPGSFSLSVVQKVLAAGKAITILDASMDADFADAKSIVALDIKTVMGVPLQSKGKLLGVMYVDSQAVVSTFTEKDLELLRAIASHASVAIENATLYETLNTHAKELEDMVALYQRAELEANTDMLTTLANRRCFMQHTGREFGVAQRYGDPQSVIMLDVDHFKKFNDTYGHAVGDQVLIAIGKVLPACVREVDLPARLGGEEFVVYLPNTGAEDAAVVAERIRDAISKVKLTDLDGNPVRQLTASLGVTQALVEDGKIDQLLERADVALYECKRHGRNQVQIWRTGMVGESAVQAL
jgi:diguanylate cyclase (GGDEF)-like protein